MIHNKLSTLIAILSILLVSMAPQSGAARVLAHEQARTTGVRAAQPAGRMLFVENRGQFDPRVQFQARSERALLWLTGDALWLTVVEKTAAPEGAAGLAAPFGRQPAAGLRGVHLKLAFAGMSPDARLVPTDPQPGRMNYFKGNDASRWRTGVPTYGTVRWEGVYPGVNIILGQAGAGPGLTVEAGAGADLSAVRLRVEGMDALRVDPDGRLIADTAIGPVSLPPLVNAEGQALRPALEQDAVTLSAVDPISAPGSPSASVPTDDPADLLYGSYLGGSAGDFAGAITLDGAGDIYLTGGTTSVDFPTTPGAFEPIYNGGNSDVIVAKLSADGSTLLYGTHLGGATDTYAEYGWTIVVDAAGNAYAGGYTGASDFPTTPGAMDPTFNGGVTDGFVTKLNPTGSDLVYSTFLGGSGSNLGFGDSAWDVALDATGAAYVTGETASDDFPTTPGALQTSYGGGPFDAFVTKLDPSGSSATYSTFLGATGASVGDGGLGIAVDATGAAHVGGRTDSADFVTSPGTFDTTFNGNVDAFVTRLTPDGSAVIYSTFLGGSGATLYGDAGAVFGVDAAGAAYVFGITDSGDFPVTPGAYDTSLNGCANLSCDIFVTKLNPDGSNLVYSTFLGGSADESLGVAAATLDGSGMVHIAGWTASPDFPTTPGAYDASYNGGVNDAFVTKLNIEGSGLMYSTFLGGATGSTFGAITYGTALDAAGAVYVAGETDDSDFPTTPGAYDTSLDGTSDAFLARLNVQNPLMIVAAVTPFWTPGGGGFRVGAQFAIQDLNGQGIPGAAVEIQVTRPNGQSVVVTRTTDQAGFALLAVNTAQTGTYTFDVLNVTKAGWIYDPTQNIEAVDSVTIP